MFNFKKKNNRNEEQEFEIINRYIKGDGRNKSIKEDSLILGFYKDYVITKDGYICGGLKITGVNTELLTKFEQSDLLEEYSSYISTALDDEPMIKTITEPVDISSYLNSLYRSVLIDMKENNGKPSRRGQLIASRILFIENQIAKGEMSTKQHYIYFKEKIKENNVIQLEHAVNSLYEKININKEALRQAFSHYGLEVRPILQEEYINQFYAIYDYKNYNEYSLNQ